MCRLKRKVRANGSISVKARAAAAGSTRRTAELVAKKKALLELRTRLSDFLTGPQLEFTMSQLRSSLYKARGRRWTNASKAFALSLLHSSPKTYRLLRRIFFLPSIQTLKKAMQNIQVSITR